MTKKLNYKRLFIGVCVALIAILICTAFFAMPLKKASAEEQPPEITPFVSDIVYNVYKWNGILQTYVDIFGMSIKISADVRNTIFADDMVFSYSGNSLGAVVGVSAYFFNSDGTSAFRVQGFNEKQSGSCILNSGKWDVFKVEVRVAFTYGSQVKEVLIIFEDKE